MTFELRSGEHLLVETRAMLLNRFNSTARSGTPLDLFFQGRLTATNQRIVFIRKRSPIWWLSAQDSRSHVEIPLSEVVYIDNGTNRCHGLKLYVRTALGESFSFATRLNSIDDKVIWKLESIVRSLRPDRFLPVGDAPDGGKVERGQFGG